MELFMGLLAGLLAVFGVTYVYWRYFYFFRDPRRVITQDESALVSPADGTVIYIKEVLTDEVLFCTKLGRKISLQEYCAAQEFQTPCYLVGIFMHPTGVHVNRAPISGEIEKVDYLQGKNLPMTLTWWRAFLGLKPYEKYAGHLFSNERNIIGIKGRLRVLVIQIADIYVNKIECWVKEQDRVSKGQRLGMIKMGSQVDVLIPMTAGLTLNIEVGRKVKAGESIIAYYREEGN
jgi:phosphatidylserine decarboxylase